MKSIVLRVTTTSGFLIFKRGQQDVSAEIVICVAELIRESGKSSGLLLNKARKTLEDKDYSSQLFSALTMLSRLPERYK